MTRDGTEYDCEAACAEIDALLRDELSLESVNRMQAHLDHCQCCREIKAYEHAFRERLRQLQQRTECPSALRSRVIALLAGHDADA